MTDSPAKTVRPLEVHSPNVHQRGDDGAASPMKCTPAHNAPRMPSAEDYENYERGHGRGGGPEQAHESFALSPIGRVDFGTPAIDMNLETPHGGAGEEGSDGDDDDDIAGYLNDLDQAMIDVSEVQSPVAAESDRDGHEESHEQDGEEAEDGEEEETEEDRARREMEESEALARQLMAEEAMASYAASTDYLRSNADQFSEEDLAALQAAMAEEDPEAEGEAEEDEGEEGAESQEMSYDALLRLGERIGDVKEEMWALSAQDHINNLPTVAFEKSMAEGKEENHTKRKCQVCQFQYEDGESLRRLPCGHCFHKECIDEWLGTKDTCALCRKSIVPEK